MRRIWSFVIPCMLASSVAAAGSPKKRPVTQVAEDEEEDEETGESETADDDAAREAELAAVAKAKAKAKKAKAKKKAPRNEFYFRAGMAHVQPRIKSGGLELQPTGLAGLAANPEPPKGGLESQSSNIISGIIGFAPKVFGGHVAFETLVGIPQATPLRAQGELATKSLAPTALGIIPTGIPPLGEEIGEAKAVPPMLTVVFRLPALGPVRPYVGAGASVLFVEGKITNAVLTEVATPKLTVSPAAGFVAQAGIDVHLKGRFYARLDLKELWFQESQSTISNIHVATTIPMLETVEVGSAKTTVQANPIIVQAGIGVTF
jgi:outer membrane protein W